jgi:hypothetical protein
MSSDERPRKTRRVISATCDVHPGTPGFCNLEVRREGSNIVLHPHAVGACTIRLNEAEAAELYVVIEELLG